MSFSIVPRQINLKLTKKSDGRTITIHIPENENYKVKYLKTHAQQIFRLKTKFHLYYKNRHIKSRYKLIYYGITSQVQHIEIMIIYFF